MPGLTRAMFVANPKTTTYRYYLAEAEAAARRRRWNLCLLRSRVCLTFRARSRHSRASRAEP